MNRFITALAVALIGLTGGWVATAEADDGEPTECPPIIVVDEPAWTETIEHPEVTEQVLVSEAWTEVVKGEPSQHYSLAGGSWKSGEFPSFPTPGEPFKWVANTEHEPHSSDNVTWIDGEGAGRHYTSSPGHTNWFYFEPGTEDQVIEHPAVYDTVVVKEAWTEIIEHPAVTHEEPGNCEEPPTEEPPTEEPPTEEPPTEEPPTEEPPVTEPPSSPGQPTVEYDCRAGTLVVAFFDAQGNKTATEYVNGAARCPQTDPTGQPFREEGL